MTSRSHPLGDGGGRVPRHEGKLREDHKDSSLPLTNLLGRA